MAMKFSPRLEAMLADWDARIKATPAPIVTDADRARLADVRRRRAWMLALQTGDALTADRCMVEHDAAYEADPNAWRQR